MTATHRKNARDRIPFKPELRYGWMKYLVGGPSLREKKIENTKIYNLVRKLTDGAIPTYEDTFDKRWSYFYLPLRREGRRICLPFEIMEYEKEFFVSFHELGTLHIKKGRKKVENGYSTIFRETLRIIPHIKRAGNRILEKVVPYDLRTGKIKGKHLMEKPMSEEEKRKVLGDYQRHLKRGLKVPQISLNGYLGVAALCYQAAYGKKARGLSPVKMYQRWADGRDGGMLSIRDRNSKKEFTGWQKSGIYAGSHPFEIVFSWRRHGIHLYPPHSSFPHYLLCVTNYAYAGAFIEMVKALIRKGVAFQARELNKVIDYLSGESDFTVNRYDDPVFHYIPCREHKKLYFHHIEWDELKVPGWKKGGEPR